MTSQIVALWHSYAGDWLRLRKARILSELE